MTTTPTVAEPALEALARAAQGVAGTLPAPAPLTPAGPQPGDEQVPAVFPRALVARAQGVPGMVGLLIGEEIVSALASADQLLPAAQPALQALGEALGITLAAAEEVAPADFSAVLAGPWSVVPLIGQGFAGGTCVTDDLLEHITTPQVEAPVVVVPATTPVTTPSVSASEVTHEPIVTGGVTRPEGAASRPVVARGIDMLHDIDMELTVELGRTRMLVRDLLALAPGDVVELDRAAGSPADLLVGGRLIARGEVVVVDEDFGLRITHIVEPSAG